VTHVALVEVKSASTNRKGSPVEALGSMSRPAPVIIRTTKLAMSVRVGFLPEAAKLTEAVQTLTVTSMIR
jgi:hypothetical protein